MRIYENEQFKLCEILIDLYCMYNDNHRDNTLTIPLLYDFQEQQHKRKDKEIITDKWLISEIDRITKLNWITTGITAYNRIKIGYLQYYCKYPFYLLLYAV